jgi:hypothetical protein
MLSYCPEGLQEIQNHTLLGELLVFRLWKSHIRTNPASLVNNPKSAELISLANDLLFFDECVTAIVLNLKVERLVECLFCRNRFMINHFHDIKSKFDL